MGSWKKILVEGDAVAGNLATANLTQSGSPRTYDLNGDANRIALKGGIVQFSSSSNTVSHQFDNVNGIFDAREANGIRLSDGNNSHYIDLKPKSEVSASYTITLPNAAPGSAHRILEADATGDLSWIDTPSGGGSIDGSGSASEVAYWSDSDTLTSNSGFAFDGTDLRVLNTVVAGSLDAGTINLEVTGLSSDGDLGRGAEVLHVSASQGTTASRMYYINSSSTWSPADKDLEVGAAGFLVAATGTNANNGMLVKGILRVAGQAISGSPTVGARLYLGDSGQFTATAPTAQGDFVRVVGHYIATNTVFFNPSNEYIEIS